MVTHITWPYHVISRQQGRIIIDRFVEEDVPDFQTVWSSRIVVSEEILNALFVHFLNDLVVEYEPEIVRLDGADVVAFVRSIPTVHHHWHETVQAFWVVSMFRRDEETQLQRKHDPVRQLLVSVVVFHVLEALQVQSQHFGLLFNAHALLRLLLAAARLAEVFLRAR